VQTIWGEIKIDGNFWKSEFSGMKFTLAMVLIVFACRGAGAAREQQSSQPLPQAEATQPSGAEQVPQQPTTPPPTPQPCAAGKDTCTVWDPAKQEPTSAPARKAQDQQSGKEAAKVTRSRKAKTRRRNAVQEQALAHDEPTTKKTIVRKGSTSDPTVLTLGATSETSYSRQTTEDLLAATDANLKQARSRSLNQNQVETVNQIKRFVEQANAAMKEGDLDRGHNLALKANLLSDDLAKH
jgi:hypothetical protein